jgi:hypothetical protein
MDLRNESHPDDHGMSLNGRFCVESGSKGGSLAEHQLFAYSAILSSHRRQYSLTHC